MPDLIQFDPKESIRAFLAGTSLTASTDLITAYCEQLLFAEEEGRILTPTLAFCPNREAAEQAFVSGGLHFLQFKQPREINAALLLKEAGAIANDQWIAVFVQSSDTPLAIARIHGKPFTAPIQTVTHACSGKGILVMHKSRPGAVNLYRDHRVLTIDANPATKRSKAHDDAFERFVFSMFQGGPRTPAQTHRTLVVVREEILRSHGFIWAVANQSNVNEALNLFVRYTRLSPPLDLNTDGESPPDTWDTASEVGTIALRSFIRSIAATDGVTLFSSHHTIEAYRCFVNLTDASPKVTGGARHAAFEALKTLGAGVLTSIVRRSQDGDVEVFNF
ncbi:MAG: hypothetical protein KF754_06575 [Planctomycetes bacterium]|nr:hypothetical protein [Planctomycetota bacterium]